MAQKAPSAPPTKSPERLTVTLQKVGADFKVRPAIVITGNMFTLENKTGFPVVFRIDPKHHPFGPQPLLEEIADGGSLNRTLFWSNRRPVTFPYQVAVNPDAPSRRKWALGASDPVIIIDR